MSDEEEKALIKRAQTGDSRAFEALVNRYYETMYKFAYKYCLNQQDAEDVTQDACIKLAKGLHSYKHDSAFTSWLYRLTINAAKDHFRKQNRHIGSSEALESVAISDSAEDKTYAREILREVCSLPEGERDALILVMADGLSHAEAAKVLDCKEKTISWRIHEARKKLSAFNKKEQKYG